MTTRVLLRGLILIGSLISIVYLIQATPLGDAFNQGWVDDDIRGQGPSGYAIFLLIVAFFTTVGFPRQVAAFLGGYAFGFGWGTFLSLLGVTIACVVAFFYARLLGRELVQRKFARKVRRIDDFLHDNPFSMTLLVRLLPVGSNVVTNLAAGISSVHPLPFIVGSCLGYFPQMAIFALVGSGVSVEHELRIAISVVLCIISGFFGAYLYRKYRHGKTLGQDVEHELGDEKGEG